MSVSAIEDMFQSLDDFYPGSKRKRRQLSPEKQAYVAPDPLAWDAKPYTKKLYGKDVEMFTIGALAKAIGKSEGTIRDYMAKGYLPNTPYRLRSVEVNGKMRPGRRLFTRDMVEAAIAAFAKRDLIDAKRVEWKNHRGLPVEIAAAWKSLQESLSA